MFINEPLFILTEANTAPAVLHLFNHKIRSLNSSSQNNAKSSVDKLLVFMLSLL